MDLRGKVVIRVVPVNTLGKLLSVMAAELVFFVMTDGLVFVVNGMEIVMEWKFLVLLKKSAFIEMH